jgi:hypothetical protein
VGIYRVVFGAAGIACLASSAVVAAVAVSPSARATLPVNYVALGDSYSSGVGAGYYISSSDANSPTSFVSVACSGATTADVLSSQVSALTASTTLVSTTIGGNDASFAGTMETCVLESTSSCLSAVSADETFVATQLPARLDTTLQTIRTDAPAAKIVVLGYPDLYDLSRSSWCFGLSTADRTALNQGAGDLDSALATAAAANGDTFANVTSAFAGHEICDPGRWLNSVNIFDLSTSYHPTANGQELGYLPVFTAAAG